MKALIKKFCEAEQHEKHTVTITVQTSFTSVLPNERNCPASTPVDDDLEIDSSCLYDKYFVKSEKK
jgi:hypothetical protein